MIDKGITHKLVIAATANFPIFFSTFSNMNAEATQLLTLSGYIRGSIMALIDNIEIELSELKTMRFRLTNKQKSRSEINATRLELGLASFMDKAQIMLYQ